MPNKTVLLVMDIHEMGMVNIKMNQSGECNQIIHQRKEKKENRIDDTLPNETDIRATVYF